LALWYQIIWGLSILVCGLAALMATTRKKTVIPPPILGMLALAQSWNADRQASRPGASIAPVAGPWQIHFWENCWLNLKGRSTKPC